jgi:hypothetical protein
MKMERRHVPTVQVRAIVAILIGATTGLLTFIHLRYVVDVAGYDFTWPWRAARALILGQNPYTVIQPTGPYPLDAAFRYPLPAAFFALPVARCRPDVAAAIFSAVSAALLAFGLTARDWGRLYILASPAFAYNAFSGQWSAMMMAGALLPTLSWVAVCKPTAGLAVFAYRPNRWAVSGGVALVLISFFLVPSWLTDWLRDLRADNNIGETYPIPVLLIGGQFLFLAALRWRRADARYLLALAVTPHAMTFYTGLLPMLVAETKREALVFALGSAATFVGKELTRPTESGMHLHYWLLLFAYLPALVMVLRRPNVTTR